MSRAHPSSKDRAAGLRPQPATQSSQSSIPCAGPERIDVAEFHRRLQAQGVPAKHMALICPMCGTVQSMASLVAAGATPEKAERLIGFSCEGRLTGAGHWPNKPTKKRRAVRGCDWSLGGLFRIHRLEVVDGGEAFPRFVVASPEQAQALRDSDATPRGREAAEGEASQRGPSEEKASPND